MIKKIDHINIVVTDLDKSSNFFVDLLGFRVVKEGHLSGEWIDKVVGLENVDAKYIQLVIPNSETCMELIQYYTPKSAADENISNSNQIGFRHIALEVKEIEKVYANLQASGVKILSELQIYNETKKLCYFLDPMVLFWNWQNTMNNISIQHYKSKFGELLMGSYDGKLCLCDWQYRKMRNQIDRRIQTGLNAAYVDQDSSVINETIKQLDEYFAGNREEFDIPLLLVGTDFQKLVWQELLKIPFGKTDSYLGLSKKLNNPKAIRAVANANGANAISIIIPCHRIIGSDGKLVGYAGGLSVKQKLLQLENQEQLALF